MQESQLGRLLLRVQRCNDPWFGCGHCEKCPCEPLEERAFFRGATHVRIGNVERVDIILDTLAEPEVALRSIMGMQTSLVSG
jgi:hypothetical protein